jgi:hypothetical protein
MGYKKEWDINSIRHQLWIMAYECSDARNDGYMQWSIKQDLYQLKWLVDELIKDAPHFSMEDEWLKEKEQEQIVEILKK